MASSYSLALENLREPHASLNGSATEHADDTERPLVPAAPLRPLRDLCGCRASVLAWIRLRPERGFDA